MPPAPGRRRRSHPGRRRTARGRHPRRATRPRRRPRGGPPPPRPPGTSAPHPSLMFLPSGSALIACTVAPSRRSSAGASSDAAPLAQSTTTRIPSSGASAASTRCARYRSRPSPIGRVWPGRSAASCGPASAASISSSISSASFVPVAVEELDAVVLGRVVGGGDRPRPTKRPGRGEERDRGGGLDAGDQGVATRVGGCPRRVRPRAIRPRHAGRGRPRTSDDPRRGGRGRRRRHSPIRRRGPR